MSKEKKYKYDVELWVDNLRDAIETAVERITMDLELLSFITGTTIPLGRLYINGKVFEIQLRLEGDEDEWEVQEDV